MNEQELLKRITANPEIFGGKPIIRGIRWTQFKCSEMDVRSAILECTPPSNVIRMAQ